jgi:phospholipid/cholesterol/gamma-HCH transport system substrate-binding protein
MQKTAPSRVQLGLMILFALSCFGILLFLWKSFGGPSPLAPKGYRVVADFNEATQLSETAEVRISGVTVGRVKKTRLAGDRTRVEMEVEDRYAPLARNTRAILRQKTLLGETYVELTPGDRRKGDLPDGGRLARSAVRPTVELDEVLRTLDPRTRRDLQRLVRELDLALAPRGEDLNDALGQIEPFATDSNALLRVLDSQRRAVQRGTRDTGVVLDALGRRQGELSSIVRSADRLLATTARRDADLADTVRILPTTLRELRPTLADAESLMNDLRPLVRDLRPAGRALGPTLIDSAALAPDLEELFGDLDRVIAVSRTALPDTTRIVDALHPVLRILVPTLREALPVVQYVDLYRQEVVTTLANLASITQDPEQPFAGARALRNLRVVVPITSETPVVQDNRLGSNRHNPYLLPRAMDRLAQGLESIDCRHEGNPRTDPAPPCVVAPPLRFQGRTTQYPHVQADR